MGITPTHSAHELPRPGRAEHPAISPVDARPAVEAIRAFKDRIQALVHRDREGRRLCTRSRRRQSPASPTPRGP